MMGMPSCRDVARLLSHMQERPVPAGERLALRAHLMLCTSCRRYARQLNWLHDTLNGTGGQADAVRLSDNAKERIRHALSEKTGS